MIEIFTIIIMVCICFLGLGFYGVGVWLGFCFYYTVKDREWSALFPALLLPAVVILGSSLLMYALSSCF